MSLAAAFPPWPHSGAGPMDRPAHGAHNLGPVRQLIIQHIQEHIGPIAGVIDSYESEAVSVDVCHVPPGPRLDAHALVTLTTPASPAAGPRAEVCVFLPRDWRIVSMHDVETDESLARFHWPLRWIVNIARMREEYGLPAQAIAPGLLVANAEPPMAYADNTEFCALVLMKPAPLPEAFGTLRAPGGDVVFLRATPLYATEVKLKQAKGMPALEAAIAQAKVSPLGMFELSRPNTVRKRFLGLL